MPTLEERVAKLEAESRANSVDIRNLKAERKELASEIRVEVRDTMTAAVQHIERVERAVREEMLPIRELRPVFDQVKVELEGNRLERERRIAARVALEQKKLDDEKDAAIDLAASDARTRARALKVTLAVAIIGGAVALLIAVINSHH